MTSGEYSPCAVGGVHDNSARLSVAVAGSPMWSVVGSGASRGALSRGPTSSSACAVESCAMPSAACWGSIDECLRRAVA